MNTYAELQCLTHYSFLQGASHPHELVKRANELKIKALAITDLNGVYGLPKAYLASQDYPDFKLICGSQVRIVNKTGTFSITLLAQNREAYGLLCKLLTKAHAEKEKGQAYLTLLELASLLQMKGSTGLIALPNLPLLEDFSFFKKAWEELKELFSDRIYLPLSRFLDGCDEKRTWHALEIKKHFGIPLVATNHVHYHHPSRRNLQDVLTCIREKTSLNEAGHRLFSNQERYLKSPLQMMDLFKDQPNALKQTLEIAERCYFSLAELRYHYPSEWIPKGYTAQSYLTHLVWEKAPSRYPHRAEGNLALQGGVGPLRTEGRSLNSAPTFSHPGLQAGVDQIPQDVRIQLEYELKLIEKLGFADYFLTIWEIIEFARKNKILCQGRGSAANSAVCYVLGITAIDPVRMNLLFERFISAERGEPPDIDVDFEHERREEVIQHIYEKYGRTRAAMVSAVVTYQPRSAIREVTKAFGEEQDLRSFRKKLETSLETSLDSRAPPPEKSEHRTLLLQKQLSNELQGFPRHLSIHSGGFTLSAEPMTEIVPIEPARMPGRTIVQWDKYDLDALGLLKVDILALGMLTTLQKTLSLVGNLSLYSIPPDDRSTYEMIQKADTVGTFQIESRAQMAMLPRLLPRVFYDLVVQVALVRPGPIVGKMVHPYLKKRKGLDRVDLPDPRLEPILGRTLGVPIFQEQVMKMAILLADFTPGEADQLRRAIGAWRSSGSLDQMGKRLLQGLLANGIPRSFADQIFTQIQGFSEYGFPESHAASFALIAYASAYLKCHYPAQFTCSLLNSQPMGFYSPHTLVDDVKRHGIEVFPIHPHLSQWDCEIEKGGIRLGFRYLLGVQKREIDELLTARKLRPFANLEDFLNRTFLRPPLLHRMALGDAFRCFGYDQRSALWEILSHWVLKGLKSHVQLSLFLHTQKPEIPLFSALTQAQAIHADYDSYRLSTRGHPMEVLRKQFPIHCKLTTARAKQSAHLQRIQITGLSVVLQRPPTAAGTAFATLEDETGFLDLILHKTIFEKYKDCILEHSFLKISGQIQKDGLSVSLIVSQIQPLRALAADTLNSPRSVSPGWR